MLKPIKTSELRKGQEFLVIDPPASHLYRVMRRGISTIHAINLLVPAGYADFDEEQTVWVSIDGRPLTEVLELVGE